MVTRTGTKAVLRRRSSYSRPAPKYLGGEKVLMLEYEQLNQWARHGEEAAHRIFNFYVSLLTAVLGGFLLITQVITGSMQVFSLIGSIVCGLLVLIGVTFLDALIGQYSRNIHYRMGIERIRARFRQDSEVADILSSLPAATLEADSETVFFTLWGDKAMKWSKKRRTIFWRVFLPLFPISTQQIFMSMVTSLLVGALICSLVWGLVGSEWLGRLLLASGLAVVLSFLAQNIMVRVSLQRSLDDLRDILG